MIRDAKVVTYIRSGNTGRFLSLDPPILSPYFLYVTYNLINHHKSDIFDLFDHLHIRAILQRRCIHAFCGPSTPGGGSPLYGTTLIPSITLTYASP